MNPDFKKAVEKIIKACKEAENLGSIFLRIPNRQKILEGGAGFVTLGPDTSIDSKLINTLIDKVKKKE